MKIKITCRPRYNPWLKNLSKLLAFGILLNSIPVNSFASILSEDTRYETFEGDSIKIDNVLEEDKVDVEIEGNTLVNIHSKQKYYFSTTDIDRDKYIETEVINSVKVTINENLSDWRFLNLGKLNLDLIKPNTKYTVYFEKAKGLEYVSFSHNDSSIIISDTFRVPVVNNKAIITTKSFSKDDLNYKYGDMLLYGHCSDKSGTEIEVSNAMIIEGELPYDSLDYFEGVKSVGQDDKNGNKVEILSQNKNLLPILNLTVDNEGYANRQQASWKNIKLKPNTKYTLSYTGKAVNNTNPLMWAILVKEQISRKDVTVDNIISSSTTEISSSFTTSDKDLYEVAIVPNNGDNVGLYLFKPNTVILEEGEKTAYIPYNSNKKEILINEPLRRLPNGVKDRIVKRNGQWVVERNIGSITLDGSLDENWNLKNLVNNIETYCFAMNSNILTKKSESKDILNDRYKSINSLWEDKVDVDLVGIDLAGDPERNRDIIIRVSKSTLAGVNPIQEFRDYLKENPVKLNYTLDTPIYEPLNMDSIVNLYEGTTHISNNSTIPANLKVTVDRTINRATEAVELAKINPTIENLSKARMWTNLLDDSIKKDELQEEINNIANIDDLQIELKSTSVNLDVYIKSENMLSMSLDTNQISFDDFSGVEDVEKTNAVNVSINSSLPYQLNAYLPNKIQNADRTKTMNKEILQLKESNETTYQAFTNTTDKVVLKDNCSSGNQLVHGIDIMLKGGVAHEKDVYKAVIKLEAEQK